MNKSSWKIKKLGEVSNILMGQSPSSDFYNTEEKGLPFYQGNADFGKLHPIVRTYCTHPIRIAEARDILISVRAPIGAINIALGRCCIGRGLASIRAIKNKTIYKYIYYCLFFYKEKLISLGTGSTFKAINKNILTDLNIQIPPIDIQKQIVEELDTLSDIITKKKEQLAELDKLAQATFYDMFGDPIKNEKEWEMRRLEELGDWASGGTPLRSNLLYFKGSIPWVTSGELNSLFINDTIEHINEEAIRNSNAKLIRKGSLLIGMYDTAALKSSINKREMACNQAIAFSFINTKLCNTIYVYYSIQINKEEYKKEQRGIRQKNLNLSMIKAISILYPPLLLQNQFAKKIEAIEQQKALINQSITDTQLLFDYTMDKYFN